MSTYASGGAPLPFDAVVLAGGSARRLGGADKPGLRVGGRTLLNRVLSASATAHRTVVVAEPRPTARPVHWTREDPPGAGPVAALAAGVRTLDEMAVGPGPGPGPGHEPEAGAGQPGPETWPGLSRKRGQAQQPDSSGDLEHSPQPQPQPQPAVPDVLVLSADLPFLDRLSVERLLAELATGECDAVLLVDGEGRDQPLVAAYRGVPLRRRLAELGDMYGSLEGLPLRRLTEGLVLGRLDEDPQSAASFDCDTWSDLATARTRIREHGHVLDEWISAVKDELGVELDVDTAVLLDLARDAAHSVARPAAPLTTFLVGYVAGQAKGGPEEVAEAARKAAALALRWAEEQKPDSPPEA